MITVLPPAIKLRRFPLQLSACDGRAAKVATSRPKNGMANAELIVAPVGMKDRRQEVCRPCGGGGWHGVVREWRIREPGESEPGLRLERGP